MKVKFGDRFCDTSFKTNGHVMRGGGMVVDRSQVEDREEEGAADAVEVVVGAAKVAVGAGTGANGS